MEVDVGVVTYERSDYIDSLLESLFAQTRTPDRIWIVDDSADDATEAVVEEYVARDTDVAIHYVRGRDHGMPAARNQILEQTSADVICFLDDDTTVDPAWLGRITGVYEDRPDVAAVGGPAISVDHDQNVLEEIRRDPENLNRITRYGEVGSFADRWIPPEPVETDALMGANMTFRVPVLTDVGGFDPDYKGNAYREEFDVFARLWHRGDQVVYHPEALAYHYQATTGGAREDVAEQRRTYYWFGRNVIRFRKKNFRDTYLLGLVRLLAYKPYYPPPLWQIVGGAVLNRDPTPLWIARGYLDGLLYEP